MRSSYPTHTVTLAQTPNGLKLLTGSQRTANVCIEQEIHNKKSLESPSHLKRVATLPCKNINVRKLASSLRWETILLKHELAKDVTYDK